MANGYLRPWNSNVPVPPPTPTIKPPLVTTARTTPVSPRTGVNEPAIASTGNIKIHLVRRVCRFVRTFILTSTARREKGETPSHSAALQRPILTYVNEGGCCTAWSNLYWFGRGNA